MTPRSAQGWIATALSRRIGFAFDPFQAAETDANPFMLLAAMENRVFDVHLSDRRDDAPEQRHLSPGEGDLPWPALLRAIAGAYSGPLMLEGTVGGDLARIDATRRLLDPILREVLEQAETPANLLIQVTDAQVKNAPFLTQILSLASLRGLADTLTGEGVTLSRIDLPMKVSDGRYVIEGAKAQGPALGLTASGFINSKTSEIEIDGVLVPSFGVNSALGGIPILGDLVVGRDGEGGEQQARQREGRARLRAPE